MRGIVLLSLGLIIGVEISFGQPDQFKTLNFLIGEWEGTGSGFGNEKSKIESSFKWVMEGKYIEVKNESRFEPTDKNPEGEHHIDKGFISYDKARKLIVFRQFNNEGYINQYVLNDSLSDKSTLVFETESIENFVPGGKARWTINRLAEDKIVTIFDVSFPEKEYACFGTNTMKKKNNQQ